MCERNVDIFLNSTAEDKNKMYILYIHYVIILNTDCNDVIMSYHRVLVHSIFDIMKFVELLPCYSFCFQGTAVKTLQIRADETVYDIRRLGERHFSQIRCYPIYRYLRTDFKKT